MSENELFNVALKLKSDGFGYKRVRCYIFKTDICAQVCLTGTYIKALLALCRVCPNVLLLSGWSVRLMSSSVRENIIAVKECFCFSVCCFVLSDCGLCLALWRQLEWLHLRTVTADYTFLILITEPHRLFLEK